MKITDKDKYTYDVAFDLTVSSNPLSQDVASAKPGEANISWSTAVSGTLTLTNTTPGHTLVTPDEFTVVCTLNPGAHNCPTLYGYYPSTSPVCTIKLAGTTTTRSGFDLASPGYHPAGSWCAVAFAEAPFSNVRGYNATVMPIGGTATTQWQPESGSGTLASDTDFPLLAAAVAELPAQWAIVSGNPLRGEKTALTPAGESICAGVVYVIWESTALTCQ